MTREESLSLAETFRKFTIALGDYRVAHWDELSAPQRKRLADAEVELLTRSTSLIRDAIDLDLDEAELSAKELTRATAKAAKVVKTIETVKHIIALTAAMLELGAGIVASVAAENPGPAVTAALGLVEVIEDITT